MIQFTHFGTTKCRVPKPASWYSMNGRIATIGNSSEAPSASSRAAGSLAWGSELCAGS